MSLYTDLVSFLEAARVGTAMVDIFTGVKPALPLGDGPFLVIKATGGATAEIVHNTPDVPGYVRPSVQIVVHGMDSAAAEAMAQAAYDALFTIQNQFIGGTWYRSVSIVQEPFELGEDDRGRPRWVFNMNIIKRSSPATS